jgi:hypothetical protein
MRLSIKGIIEKEFQSCKECAAKTLAFAVGNTFKLKSVQSKTTRGQVCARTCAWCGINL